MDGLEVLPIRGIGDVTAGDDLAELITNAAPWLVDGDVLVVTSKIVSKAEGPNATRPARRFWRPRPHGWWPGAGLPRSSRPITAS